MASLSTADAARALGVSVTHLKHLAAAVRVKPDRRAVGGLGRGYRLVWGIRHLFALALLEPLARLLVAPAPAITFAWGLAGQPSDEAFEAVIEAKAFALIVPPYLNPRTVDESAVQRADAHRGKELRRQGRDLIALDLRPLLADLTARIRAMTTEGAADAQR